MACVTALDAEINAFNAAATSHTDGRLLGIAFRKDGVTCGRACSGGRGAEVATFSFSG